MKAHLKSLIQLLLALVFIISCTKKDDLVKPNTSKVPQTFSVDIPNSLSPDNSSSNLRITKNSRLSEDTVFDGGAIYEGIRGYIAVGEIAAKAVTEIMKVASVAVGFNVSTVVYLGENDRKIKRMTLSENATYLSKNYAYKLLIKDSLSGQKGLEVYWNNNPIDGVAILSPYYLDQDTSNAKEPDALFKVEYSENMSGYDKQMTVYITGLATPEDGDLNNLKMFAGVKGNILEINGNSNHPSISLFGLGNANYAFRAKSDISQDLAVAQVILPPSTVSSTLTSDDIAVKYSVKNIISNWAINEYPILGTESGLILLNKYLKNTVAPGYFVKNLGFVKAEVAPDGYNFSDEIKNLSSLNFYIPNDIRNLSISFDDK